MAAAHVSLLHGRRLVPATDRWQALLDAAKALLMADSARAEFLLAMASVAWGGFLLLEFDTFSLPAYGELRSVMLPIEIEADRSSAFSAGSAFDTAVNASMRPMIVPSKPMSVDMFANVAR